MTIQILTPDEVRAQLGLPALQHIAVSEKPWGDYTEADYSLEQWHKACLIHLHDGAPTSKAQCKLPVRTPDGTLSRNGVHAAAAALAGARGGVNAPMNMKRAAARQIMTMYNQLDEKAPPSMGSMMQSVLARTDAFLAHFGIRGMKWGVRRSEGPDGTVGSAHPPPAGGHAGSEAPKPTEGERAAAIAKKIKKSGLESITNEEMQVLVSRMRLERDLTTISAESTKIAKGREFMNRQLRTGKTINDAIKFANSPAGHLLFAAMGHKSTGRHTRSTAKLVTPKLAKMNSTKP